MVDTRKFLTWIVSGLIRFLGAVKIEINPPRFLLVEKGFVIAPRTDRVYVLPGGKVRTKGTGGVVNPDQQLWVFYGTVVGLGPEAWREGLRLGDYVHWSRDYGAEQTLYDHRKRDGTSRKYAMLSIDAIHGVIVSDEQIQIFEGEMESITPEQRIA